MFLFLLTCIVTFIKMATTTYHETYTNKHYQSQIPHFVGTKNTNSKRIPKFSKGCCSNVTKENLNMQNISKENCHHDNYILHRYLNSKYQQEKVFKSIRGMSNNYQQNQYQSNNNLVLNKLSSLPLSPQKVSSSATSSPQKKNSIQLVAAATATKRPLSTSNTNIFHNLNEQQQHSSPRKTLLNGNLIAKAKTILAAVASAADKPPLLIENYELNDESLRNNVQIVLQNINQNFQHNHGQTISLNDLHFLSDSFGGSVAAATSAIMSLSPESDCNSNPTTTPFPNPTTYNYLQQPMMPIDCSVASSQDFTHDNLDYQWCPDYGYRDPISQQHQSVLSSLFSYSGIGELSYYEDLAKNIDANLAEVDMESFCAEDIHSLLTNLPTICSQQQDNTDNRQKMSLQDFDNSICKSELLFSPVKESHISVDSLDMDGYPDDENIILTCKANKDNYTIAFEGSAIYSDDSFYDGPEYSNAIKMKQHSVNLNNFTNKLLTTSEMNTSMSKSENGYTTWSKLRQSNTALEEQQSQEDIAEEHHDSMHPIHQIRHLPHCYVNKSSSMPNLKTILSNQLQISDAISNSTVDSYGHQRALLPHYPMPISTTSDIESPNVEKMLHESVAENDTGSGDNVQNAPSFNLVKLFIKQKSNSTDTCMDVSSGCWPSDSSSSDNTNNNNTVSGCGRMRKRSMNDSGKGSALSRHDEEEVPREEEEFQYDSLDCTAVNEEQRKRANTAVSSPMKVHKQGNYKDLHLNIRHQLKHPALYNLMQPVHHQKQLNNSINNNNNNHSHSDTSHTSENLTQIFNINKSRTETISKSIQTSMIKEQNIRIVPPSFLAKLNQEERNRNKGRVFVVYPNYALPDLGFVSTAPNELILSPIGYKDGFGKMKSRRPVSLNDVDAMKSRQYGHVIDWKSLMTLLPTEYRKILKNIPEANEVSMDASLLANKPLFSMTPPIRTNRAVSCDCAYILSNTQATSSSSGGSSSQPPSSGYRGSSTILTDSDMNDATGNNMYVYQYDEAPKDRPPSGRTPKGILRRANTARSAKNTGKRSSMFEGGEYVMTTAEKRRSLQEPFYATQIIEDYIAEMEGHETRMNNAKRNLLPNYPKQREEYLDHRQSKMQGIDDVDFMMPKNASHQKRNSVLDHAHEIEARIRAERFLINVPKSDLKHYAEIANILETVPDTGSGFNSIHLRNEVSRALSSQQPQSQISTNPMNNNRKQVQFTKPTAGPSSKVTSPMKQRSPITARLLKPNELRFNTPPNSPNMSVMTSKKQSPTSKQKDAEKEKQEKIQSNRFKRLQIQWELLSKDAAQRAMETKSGGTTPLCAPKSRIPRPVSYPAATRASENKTVQKSPTRMITPKKYNIPKLSPTIAPAPTPRTPSRTPTHTTPKKTILRPSSVRTR